MGVDPFSTFSTFHQQSSFATLNGAFGDEEQLAKALALYNSNTPSGQETVLIPVESKHVDVSSVLSDQTSLGNNRVSSDPLIDKYLGQKSSECRGYIRVVMNLRRPINVLPGTRPPSTYTIVISTIGKIMQQIIRSIPLLANI